MADLTNDNVTDLMHTGNEITAQCISANLEELYIGVGPTAYMMKDDAKKLLSDDEFDTACNHPENLNPLFIHLDSAVLFQLLRREDFTYSEND